MRRGENIMYIRSMCVTRTWLLPSTIRHLAKTRESEKRPSPLLEGASSVSLFSVLLMLELNAVLGSLFLNEGTYNGDDTGGNNNCVGTNTGCNFRFPCDFSENLPASLFCSFSPRLLVMLVRSTEERRGMGRGKMVVEVTSVLASSNVV